MSVQAELEFRDSILDRMEASEVRRVLLERLRQEMRGLYRDRDTSVEWKEKHGYAFVTATDARERLESWSDVPPQEELNRNFLGGLFRGGWRAIGMQPSGTAGSHGRRELRWAPA
ncbi:MAG: hypothetical protein QME96_05860 [Myxococcota bacterium]|nr:hypothetical protein [Myxococcota bacterium]